MREYQAWRELTGDVGDPSKYGRADLDRLLTKALKTVKIHKVSSNSEKHRFLNDFFEAAGSDCEAATYAFDAALHAKAEISLGYLKGILKHYPGPDTKDSAPDLQVAEDNPGTAARGDKAEQMDQSVRPSNNLAAGE